MENTHNEQIIIGAGLTGITLGNLLIKKGKHPLILEKSRGTGGRLATRRIDGQGLDHGAPFLDSISQTEGYFTGGMSSFAKSLAADLNILKEQKVQKIFKDCNLWRLVTESGQEFSCKKLVLTAPIPQAVELLQANNLIDSSHPLFGINYSKALVLLVIAQEIPTNLTSGNFGEHSFYLMRERSLHPQGIVIHLSDKYAEKYFEQSDEAIVSLFMELLTDSPLSGIHIEKSELKKWRYSKAINTYPTPYCEVQPNLYLCGDGFTNSFISSEMIADHL